MKANHSFASRLYSRFARGNDRAESTGRSSENVSEGGGGGVGQCYRRSATCSQGISRMAALNAPTGKELVKASWRLAKVRAQCDVCARLIDAGDLPAPACSRRSADSHVADTIFAAIFADKPELRPLFEGASCERDTANKVVTLRRHARVFDNMIELIVKNIDELEQQISPALICYGRRHFYKPGVVFDHETNAAFKAAILRTVAAYGGGSGPLCAVCAGRTANAEAVRLVAGAAGSTARDTTMEWSRLLDYMFAKLMHGYELERAERRHRTGLLGVVARGYEAGETDKLRKFSAPASVASRIVQHVAHGATAHKTSAAADTTAGSGDGSAAAGDKRAVKNGTASAGKLSVGT